MRIGIAYQEGAPNVGYRGIAPGHALAERGHDVALVTRQSDGSFDTCALFSRDIVHFYRDADVAVQRIIVQLQQRRTAVTWDVDDDVRLIPEHRRHELGVSELGVHREFQAQIKVLRRVDVATTTTDYLADRFREAGADHVAVIPNHLNALQYAPPQLSRGEIVIGWVGASEHRSDVHALGVSDLLRRVLERHAAVRVVTVGVRLDLPGHRYQHHGYVPFVDLPQIVRQFDIGIAPVADLPMSRSRSNVKIKEYAAAGVPWLASARGPYLGLGEKQGGILVEDDGWDAALDQLVTRRFLRFRLRRRAIAWAKTQAIERHVDLWLDAFEQAIDIRTQRAEAHVQRTAAAASRNG